MQQNGKKLSKCRVCVGISDIKKINRGFFGICLGNRGQGQRRYLNKVGKKDRRIRIRIVDVNDEGTLMGRRKIRLEVTPMEPLEGAGPNTGLPVR